MTMRWKRRYLILAPLLGVALLFVEIAKYDASQICHYCHARQNSVGCKAFVFGWCFESSTESDFELSRFQQDYPDFNCKHQWDFAELRSKLGWDSPLIVSNWDNETFSTRSTMLSYYNEREEFRKRLNAEVDRGEVSPQRIVQLAGMHCMCGGRHFHPDSEEDRILSELMLVEDSR